MICTRPLRSLEQPLLAHFLALAAHEEGVGTVLSNSALVVYVEGWGRVGDCAVVAEESETGMVVGLAWARFWTNENHGFGWMDEVTPEMAIAVEPQFRGRGIGSELIEALKHRLRAGALCGEGEGLFAPVRVGLNVRAESSAVRLYKRLGFVKVEGSERQNRTGGVSFNMVAAL